MTLPLVWKHRVLLLIVSTMAVRALAQPLAEHSLELAKVDAYGGLVRPHALAGMAALPVLHIAALALAAAVLVHWMAD